MKLANLLIMLVLLALGQQLVAQDIDVQEESTREAYAIGVNIGRNLLRQGVTDLNHEALFKGLTDAFSDGETLITNDEVSATLQAFSKKLRDKQMAEREKQVTENLETGKKFLEENKQRPEIIETASGLQYEVLAKGSGESPASEDNVTVHYKGTLLDGTEFDSSYKRNQPATFQLNRVIKGWTEGLQLMSPGAKHKLYIPAALAYGEAGSGQNIPPNSALIFEVELISVEKKATPKPQAITSDIIKVPSKEGLERGEKIEIIKAEDVEKEIQKQKSEN